MIKSLSFYEFFLKGVFVLIWRTIRPNMNNDVVGIFLNLGLSETDLLFLRQEKNCTFVFLLESFAFLKPAIIESPVINAVPFLHSSDCLGGSNSDGFDSDALILASSVSVTIKECQ